MRELPLNIEFEKGLRPDFRNARNSGYLTECFNGKITKHGLVPYEPISIPFSQLTLNSNAIEVNWPFPQLLKGSSKTILADKNRIFLVDEDSWDLWLLSNYFTALTPANSSSIAIGNQWQFTEFWDTWMLSNGINTVFHYGKHLMKNETDKMYIGSAPRVQAGCAFKGRAWMAGFDANFFWTSAWDSLISTFANTTQNQASNIAITESFKGLGENFVWWSSIGGGDMFLLFIALTELQQGYSDGGFSATDPYVLDKIKQNTFGSMPMKWAGKIRQIKPLGEGVMVYGDGGVSALVPKGDKVGLVEFTQLSAGVSNTGAVGGNEEEHLFVDNKGYLWHIDKSFKPTELGYKEFMFPMLGRDIVITYNPSEDGEFYICDDKRAYILTKSGLTEHGQQVTSIISTQGRTYGLGDHADAMADMEFRLATDTIGQRNQTGLKHIQWVDIMHEVPEFPPSGNEAAKLMASVDFKFEAGKPFVRGTPVEVNDMGQAYVGVSGKDFRFRLSSTDYRDVNIDTIRARYQVEDRRFVRGASVSQGDKF